MNKKSIKIDSLSERLKSLKLLSWDDLSYEMMHLDIEFNNIKRFLKPSQIQLYQDFINLYELEKVIRFPKIPNYGSYTAGPRNAMAAWVEITENDLDKLYNTEESDEELG